MNKVRFFLIGVLVLVSLFLRLYKLESIPVILNRDEAALAYNGYLLAETGRDEWGERWPLTLASFGDYKLPGYPALLAGIFTVVEPSDFWVRFPSAVAGSISIILVYLIARESKWNHWNSTLAAVIFAATPVFFFYSRIAFEANVALLLFLAALVAFYTSVAGSKRILIDVLGIIFWIAGALTYNTPLLLAPFLLPLFIVGRGLFQYKRWLFPVLSIAILSVILFSSQARITSQKSGVTIFSEETHVLAANEYREQFSGLTQTLLGNKYVYYGIQMGKNTSAAFSPIFLVQKGGAHPLHQQPGFSHVTASVYIFGILGIGMAVKAAVYEYRKKGVRAFVRKSKTEALLLYVTFISLIPASITVDAPHATRSLLFFLCLVFASVYAVKLMQKNIGTLFLVVSVLLFGRYVTAYYEVYPTKQPALLQPGYQQVIQRVDESTRGPVAVVDPDGYHYILTAWYTRMDASEYFNTTIRQQPNTIGFRYGEQVGRYHFIGSIEDRDLSEKVVLIWRENEWHIQTY